MTTIERRSAPLNIVLNTWFLLQAREEEASTRTFGGLPNDFLTLGASSLFIVDQVICDEDGLATEAAMPWVSSYIFKELQAQKVLRPERLRANYSVAVLSRLNETGLLSWAQEAMRQELLKIDSGNVSDADLTLPSAFRWLNAVMFMGVDLPDTLHYDYQENHFSALSVAAQRLTTVVAPPIGEALVAEDQAERSRRLLAVLRVALPDFALLPPITDQKARAALRENIEREKRQMYRYIYGAMPHWEYERLRKGPGFEERDKIIDSKARFGQAEKNLELLFRVRDKTTKIRPYAQRVIRDVVEGRRPVEDVQRELQTIRSTIEDALKREAKIRGIEVLAGAHALLGAVELVAGHNNMALLYGSLGFSEAALAFREASETREMRGELGREFPLAWIAGQVDRERKKG